MNGIDLDANEFTSLAVLSHGIGGRLRMQILTRSVRLQEVHKFSSFAAIRLLVAQAQQGIPYKSHSPCETYPFIVNS